ncbi:hypothetical protein PUNSTDRAFT_82032, partial [Punctularia strigosozonata HHB-11173 SS5]|uniref:uncharacterized protein n=1 Tax=Punctularia strigosozonata (strain HHB-11173) TaxID=741275 RepID=UPI0004416DFA
MSGLSPTERQFEDAGQPATSSSAINPRANLQRSVSRSSTWSMQDNTPQHHNYGTSYFPPQASRTHSPTPRRVGQPSFPRSASHSSTRRGLPRSASVTKLRHDESGLLSEAEEDDEADRAGSSRRRVSVEDERTGDADDEDDSAEREEDPITLRDRQSLINVEHPFGLPIWKPALYKKSRSVTRNADQAVHSIPTGQASRLLPGNVMWAVLFGWWLAMVCIVVSAVLYVVPKGGRSYSNLVFGLGWYIVWPFGKYVAGDVKDRVQDEEGNPRSPDGDEEGNTSGAESQGTEVPGSANDSNTPSKYSTIRPRHALAHQQSVSWNPLPIPDEQTSLLRGSLQIPVGQAKWYGTIHTSPASSEAVGVSSTDEWLGTLCFWFALICIIAPLLLFVCLVCWGAVITVPMAKLNWALIEHLFRHPTSIRFYGAPPAVVVPTPPEDTIQEEDEGDSTSTPVQQPQFSLRHRRLSAGQEVPSGESTSTVLLCIYEAVGWQYYKYTIGGVNIMFVNLMPLVFFTIFDGLVLLPLAERKEERGEHVPAILAFLASQALVFLLSLLSVIPLSYFIGMAVASISAQSSIGMGAVINATFGSIIEIILYGIALKDHKGRLVEGSIIGSLLAGVLLMPGASMCSSAVRRKEQRFNAKSAGVTSTLLITAIIGALAPTMFYQTYGNFQLVCEGCPDDLTGLSALSKPWQCDHCYYEHPEPINDPFYRDTVKSFTYFCAIVLLLSYLIGLWFSLRTHASQIWQNPQQLLHPLDIPSNRLSLYHKLLPPRPAGGSLRRKPSNLSANGISRSETPVPRNHDGLQPADAMAANPHSSTVPPTTPGAQRRVSYAVPPATQPAVGYTPLLESVNHAIKDTAMQPMELPPHMTTDDFTRAIAVATVSALRDQHHTLPGARARVSGAEAEEAGGHGGHDAPSWSRATSASVLLACTALYAIIAEILVDVVDVVLEGSGIDEKFLGVTLFALVPNTTEFMNAMAFALNGNIALSMEIGSAYALQVCLLQIPAMLAFSAIFVPDKMGSVADTFPLLFPRWDVIVIVLAVFLMTYTYIEARSNYHRGSMLILSYLVLVVGFFFAPYRPDELDNGLRSFGQPSANVVQQTKLIFAWLFAG